MKVTQVISQTMEKWPDQMAVVEKNIRWTYARLGQESRLLQARLRDTELDKRDRVVVWLKNGSQYIATYLALLEVDAVVVAIHPDSAISDVLRTIEHAGAAGIVTTSNLWERNRDALEKSRLRFAMLPQTTLSVSRSIQMSRSLDGLAQIVYTSGTTGTPKGVMLSHDNLVTNTRSILARLSLSPSDSVVATLPFAFAYGNSVLLTHLFTGAKIVIEGNLMYARCIVESMKKEGVTGFSGVASNYAFLLRQSGFNEINLPSVRYFTSAGGPMPQGLLGKVRECFPASDFHVMYGQTEATARLTMLAPKDLDRKHGSAGRTVPGVSIKILDETGEPVPPGKSGEIAVAGANIMQGYWLDPTATERRIKNGILHTGDLGYSDEEGYLFITGRSSEMIKSGGFRVNPEEIEEVLRDQDGVSDAGVAGVADDLLGEVIVAGVVVQAARESLEKRLLAHCASHLSPYKRPQAIYLLAGVPRSANGKILRLALRERLESLHRQNTLDGIGSSR